MKAVIPKARKHEQIYRALERDIQAGRWKGGIGCPARLSSCASSGVADHGRPRRRDLQLAGLVDRRAGSGTYVTRRKAPPARSAS